MSASSRSDSATSSSSIDVEELFHIGERCRELRMEKDTLQASQSQSYGLIKKLESFVRRLNEARCEDRRHIQELEHELSSCRDEVESLRDQLSAKNMELFRLTEELNQSNLKVSYLTEAVESKDLELKDSTSYIEKLEETVSLAALESQCEIESLRLEMLSLEQSSLEASGSEGECTQEKEKIRGMIEKSRAPSKDACGVIETLEGENDGMLRMLEASQTQVKLFVERVEEHFKELLEKIETSDFGQRRTSSANPEVSRCGEVLGPLLVKLLSLKTLIPDSVEFEKMSHQIREFELLVKRLKGEIKEEKLKAKDEAEDLAQEMAELRYHMMQLLEEERKRRACIEQASLQRIVELEKQLQIERRKVVTSICQTD